MPACCTDRRRTLLVSQALLAAQASFHVTVLSIINVQSLHVYNAQLLAFCMRTKRNRASGVAEGGSYVGGTCEFGQAGLDQHSIAGHNLLRVCPAGQCLVLHA